MSFDSTVTELETDVTTAAFEPAQRRDSGDFEPDLEVDGLSNSVLSRLFGLFDRTSR